MNNKTKVGSLFLALGLILSATFHKFYFLRKPLRNTSPDKKVLTSPANGKVIGIRRYDFSGKPETEQIITETKNGSIPGAVRILASDVSVRGHIISIALNLTNVHYQRACASGVVLGTKYTPGSFKNALRYDDENFLRAENEHNEILLSADGANIKYKIVQIAGFIARSIEAYVSKQQTVTKGEIIGLINFGSQVTVILPENVQILVAEGQMLIDGETPIAQISEGI